MCSDTISLCISSCVRPSSTLSLILLTSGTLCLSANILPGSSGRMKQIPVSVGSAVVPGVGELFLQASRT